MERWLILVLAILSCCSMIYCHPSEERRGCGNILADMLALVCKDRGYNYYLSPEEPRFRNNRRYRRGIVEECCYSVCSLKILEQYCSPVTTETPDNAQIRKRSGDSGPVSEALVEQQSSPSPPTVDRLDDGVLTPAYRNHIYNIKVRSSLPMDDGEILNYITPKKPRQDSKEDSRQNESQNTFKQSSASTEESQAGDKSKKHRLDSGYESVIVNFYKKMLKQADDDNSLFETNHHRKGVAGEENPPEPAAASSKEKHAKVRCNSLMCQTDFVDSSKESKETRTNSIERVRNANTRQGSGEDRKIRHSNHYTKKRNNSSREQKPDDYRPAFSQVGTINPYFLEKGKGFHVPAAARFSSFIPRRERNYKR